MTVAAEPSGTQTNVLRSRRGRGGRLRARLAGLAAVCGVLLGILAFPQAASAQGEFVGNIRQGHDPQLDIGGAAATVIVDIMAVFQPGQGPKDADVSASLSGLDGLAYVGVGGACEATGDSSVKCSGMSSGESREVQFYVTPSSESDLVQGQNQSGTLDIQYPGGTLQTSVTVNGTGSNSVPSISGEVTSNAEPVSGAEVKLTDGEGKTHETTTGDDGKYTFTSGEDPIAPGDMTLVVTADGYEEKEEQFQVNEGGGDYSRNVTLTKAQEEQPSSAAPTSAAPSSVPPANDSGEEEGGGMSGTLIILIVIGALLVIGGIVGIFFLLRGGKDDKDDDGESFAPDTPPDHTPTAAQVGTPGVYQAGPAPGSDAPTMIHPGGLIDSAAANPAAPTQFGPAYGGGSDSTQVMPQGGFGAAPGMPGGQLGPDGTTILPVVKQPGGPGASDATQIMPQANLGSKPPAAPPSPYGDLGATRPHPGPSAPPSPYSAEPPGSPASPGAATRPHPGPSPAASPSPYGDLGSTRPHPAPTPPPSAGSMFEPQNPGIAPSAPREQGYGAPSAPRDQSYGPQGSPSAPQYGPGAQGPGAHGSPSAPPEPYPGQSMRRDPYAPQEQPPPAGGDYGATRAMPQYGGDQSQPPAPYGGDANRDGDGPDSKRTDRRNWGEWDDRPRSW